MKRRMLTLMIAVLILASIPINAFANTSRIIGICPGLSFSGTVATCSLNVTTNNQTDTIEAVLKLWDGTRCLETWHISGTFILMFSDTHNVFLNHEYKLSADVKINGISNPRVWITAKCE